MVSVAFVDRCSVRTHHIDARARKMRGKARVSSAPIRGRGRELDPFGVHALA